MQILLKKRKFIIYNSMGNYCCSRIRDDCFKLAGYSNNYVGRSNLGLSEISNNSYLSSVSKKNRPTNVEYSSMFISPLNTPSPSDVISESILSSNNSINLNNSLNSMTSSTELEVA